MLPIDPIGHELWQKFRSTIDVRNHIHGITSVKHVWNQGLYHCARDAHFDHRLGRRLYPGGKMMGWWSYALVMNCPFIQCNHSIRIIVQYNIVKWVSIGFDGFQSLLVRSTIDIHFFDEKIEESNLRTHFYTWGIVGYFSNQDRLAEAITHMGLFQNMAGAKKMQISMAKMNKHDVVSRRVSGCAIPSRHGPGSKFFTPRMSRVAWFSYWFHSVSTLLLSFHRADGHPLVIAVRCFRPGRPDKILGSQ